MTQLVTERLRLREMKDSDATFMLESLNEPAFLRHVGDRGVRTVAEAQCYLRERVTSRYQQQGYGVWLVTLQETGEAIGICGLIKRETLEDIDLGFSFLERFWGRGYAFEAAEAVMDYGWKVAKLPRIVAVVSPHNTASIRLLNKLGLSFERKVRLSPSEPELELLAIARPPGASVRFRGN